MYTSVTFKLGGCGLLALDLCCYQIWSWSLKSSGPICFVPSSSLITGVYPLTQWSRLRNRCVCVRLSREVETSFWFVGSRCWLLLLVFVCQVLLGIHYLHVECGIIHTDLKPENILFCVSEQHIKNLAEMGAGSRSSSESLCARFRSGMRVCCLSNARMLCSS